MGLGCGGSVGNISGKVYQKDGTVVPGGRLVFYPSSGGNPVTATIAEDGSYKAEKIPAGRVTITLNNSELDPKYKPTPPVGQGGGTPAKQPPMGGGPPPGAMGPPKDATKDKAIPSQPQATRPPGKYVPLHPSYADASKTDLTFEVKSGDQSFDIKLSK